MTIYGNFSAADLVGNKLLGIYLDAKAIGKFEFRLRIDCF